MGLLDGVKREINFVRRLGPVVLEGAKLKPGDEYTVADMIDPWSQQHPDHPAILFEDQVISWKEFDERASQTARWAQSLGLKQGDGIVLYMENKPEFIITWYGMAKVGVRVAMINNSLTGTALAHTLKLSEAKHVVIGSELADNYATAVPLLEEPLTVWAQGGSIQGMEDFDAAVAEQDPAPISKAARAGLTNDEKMFYIYTSGTTGLPKAANISHMRFMGMGVSFAGSMQTTKDDRIYVTLPLYHATGGAGGVMAALTVGGTLIIRRKFSASQFFPDLKKYNATAFTYIGELCRYLMNSPVQEGEDQHNVRVAMGNGLRPEVWGPFVERFKIPQICELYGSTEGNVGMVNVDNKIGAIGRIPNWARKFLPVHVVKFNVEEEDVVRGPDGFCIECEPGEPGEAIGKIDMSKPTSRFEGYSNKEATEKKILRDVFEKGDMYFRTGDLLSRDEHGYFYFVDRIGDTFRWKGENVATSEVAEVLSVIDGIKEANVYGVQIPGTDGRAGMAAIVADENSIDFSKLYNQLEANLPAYARPAFLRLQPEMEVTGTFKHRKVDLVKEGYNPDDIDEPIYVLHPSENAYVKLDKSLFDQINSGEIRL